MFPPYREVFFHCGPLFFFGLVLLAVAWATRVGRGIFGLLGRTRSSWFRIAPLWLGGAFIVMGCSVIAGAGYARIDPDSVVELEFTRIDREHGQTGAIRTFANAAQVSDALKLLTKATLFRRSHESLSDGYIVRFKLKGDEGFSNYGVFVYRRTSRGGSVSVVVPRSIFGVGEYSAPEFHDWIEGAIDPLFVDHTES